jgi:hypothetical protein
VISNIQNSLSLIKIKQICEQIQIIILLDQIKIVEIDGLVERNKCITIKACKQTDVFSCWLNYDILKNKKSCLNYVLSFNNKGFCNMCHPKKVIKF